jgi:hypothetical protein
VASAPGIRPRLNERSKGGLRITHALPAPGACAPSGVTCVLSRLVLAHESRQAPSSVKRARYPPCFAGLAVRHSTELVKPISTASMATFFRWIMPLALLAGCSFEGEERPQEVDLEVVAILGTVLGSMNAEGDSVRSLHGVFCSSDRECEELEVSDPDVPPELERVASTSGIPLVFGASAVGLPPCSWTDVGGGPGGFLVWFEEPKIVGDSTSVTVERFCAVSPSGSAYGQSDFYELMRAGSGWRVVAVHRVWET